MLQTKKEEVISKEINPDLKQAPDRADTIISLDNKKQLCSKLKANFSSTSNKIIHKILYIENVLSNHSKIKELASCRGLKEEVEKSLSNINISSLSRDFTFGNSLAMKSQRDSNKRLEKCMKKVILVLLIVALCAMIHLALRTL